MTRKSVDSQAEQLLRSAFQNKMPTPLRPTESEVADGVDRATTYLILVKQKLVDKGWSGESAEAAAIMLITGGNR